MAFGNVLRQVVTIDDQSPARFPQHMKISCGVLMIEAGTDRIVIVEQKARDDLPADVVGIPKGSFDRKRDISLRDCAVREFEEETGISARTIALQDRAMIVMNERDRRILYVFLAIVDHLPPDMVAGPEIAAIYTLTPREFIDLCARKKRSKETDQMCRLFEEIMSASGTV
jgi:8-oxo-dGTP pyrophosphatase MutT (NUDIX family)